MKKLSELNPRFVGAGGPGITREGKPVPKREGVGIFCDCPCGCDSPLFVHFENPLDGESADWKGAKWQRTGETFETLTLRPSLQRVGGCGWHGHLTDGVFKEC